MVHELLFRGAIGVLAVGMYGNHLAHRKQFPSEMLGGWIEKALVISALLWSSCLILYALGYHWLPISLPLWLRWTGVVCMLSCVPLSTWVYRTLGKHFSKKLQLLERHTLVRHGPYRLVRHPMYVTFFLCAAAVSIATANVLILLLGLAIAACMAWRTRHEEAMLIGRFGEHYLAYCRVTGKFLPKIPRCVPQFERTLP